MMKCATLDPFAVVAMKFRRVSEAQRNLHPPKPPSFPSVTADRVERRRSEEPALLDGWNVAAMATSSSSGRTEQRGPMQRAAVLEDIIRTVPPEVAGQVETISKEEAKLVSGPRPGIRRSQTSTLDVWGHAEDGAAATGAPSDITLQRRCAQLESQLDKWVGIAQLLASELAYREKRLWEWQMDQTNTKVIMQKFKDRLKKGNRSGRGERPDGGAGASGPSPLARSAAGAGTGGTLAKQPMAPGTPRTIPTSAHGISLLVIMPHEAEARALSQTCTQMGYRVTVGTSGEEALDIVTQAQKRPRGFAAQGGSASLAPFELVLCDVELPGIPGVEVGPDGLTDRLTDCPPHQPPLRSRWVRHSRHAPPAHVPL